jgi:hypothetical protein
MRIFLWLRARYTLNLILGVMRGFMTIQTTFDADAEDIGKDEIDIMFREMQIDLQESLRDFLC